jgi:hypothetical protein
MNTIHFPKRKDPAEEQAAEETRESIISWQHEVNTNEGSEFLDDAIRTKDQPLGETTAIEHNPVLQ